MKMENKEHKEVEEQAKETQTQNATETEKELTDAEKLEAANEEIAQLKDKYLRQVAEFDNYRKRTLKEKTELILNGGEKVLSALLPILDDFDRAIENIQKSDDVNALKEGVELIAGKLNKTLASQGLQKWMPLANLLIQTIMRLSHLYLHKTKTRRTSLWIACSQATCSTTKFFVTQKW